MTDKKIEDYLERAEKIAEKNYNIIFAKDIIEIAKMIQLEEHREQYPRIETDKDGFMSVREIPTFEGTRGQLEDLYKGEDAFIN